MSTAISQPKQERPAASPGPLSTDAAAACNTRWRWIILIGLITAAIMEVLDTTIVTVAIPQMAGNLNASTDEIAWVSTGYILSNVVVLPMTAWLGQRFGRKNYLCFSIVLFIVASFFCGTSRGLLEVVLWRIAQGGGGAALLSTAQSTLRQIFPKEEQTIVQTIFTLGIIVAPTLGPTLGGIITDQYYWPWCFFINVPIGLVSLAIVFFFLRDTEAKNPHGAVDFAGILLLASGLGAMQYVLEEGQRNDWFDSVVIVRLAVISAICLISLVVWELSPRNTHPIINFRILKNRSFSAGLVLFLALGFGLYGAVFIFPLFTQQILGFSPTATGLTLMPGGLASAVSAMACGALMANRKADPRVLIIIGFTLFAWSMWDLGHLSIASGEPDTRLALIIRGFGLGCLFVPINNVLFAALKGPEVPQGSAFINLCRQLGGSFGIAVLNTYVTNQMQFHRFNLVSYVTSADPTVDARRHGIASMLTAHGYSAPVAQAASLGMLDHTVQAQAAVMAYNDGFLMLGIFFVIASPAIFLLKPAKAPVQMGAGE